MDAILPEDEHEDYPTGFSIVGHVGKLANSPDTVRTLQNTERHFHSPPESPQ